MRLIVLAALALGAIPALAHTSGRGFVMLLPTGLYILGGAAAVALSFAIMAIFPSRVFERITGAEARFAYRFAEPGAWPSALGLALLGLLVYAGFTSSRDPLVNPLPTFFWSLWWVGFTFVVAIFGDLWPILNPWRALHRLVGPRRALAAYPAWLGAWPAVAAYFVFAWFELVYPAPFDPAILAAACLAYALVTLGGMVVFGADAWLAQAEAFSLFFRMVGWLSPFRLRERRLVFTLPCSGVLRAGPLRLSHAAFVVLVLASVTFDGLSRSFWWLGVIGENPLEYPGRTALLGRDTLGLAATWIAMLGASLLAAGGARGFRRYVASLVPIAFGYHFAHYLASFLVDAQYAARALADPLGRGWNLTGMRDWPVRASILSSSDSVQLIWNVQVAAIVLAHVAAVWAAHAIALREHAGARAALLSQAPMTLLMVGYTVLGLWLLSTPVAG